jgi:hypothetical protein
MNVLGSFGLDCGTTEELVEVPEPEPLPLLERLLLDLLLCETATPTPTPIPMRARRPMTEPKIYEEHENRQVGRKAKRKRKRERKRTIHLRRLLLSVSYVSCHGAESMLR